MFDITQSRRVAEAHLEMHACRILRNIAKTLALIRYQLQRVGRKKRSSWSMRLPAHESGIPSGLFRVSEVGKNKVRPEAGWDRERQKLEAARSTRILVYLICSSECRNPQS